MAPAGHGDPAPVPPPAFHRSLARGPHLDALTLVRHLQLLELCGLAVRLTQRQCPPPLPAGPGGAPRVYSEDSLLLLAMLRTLWRLASVGLGLRTAPRGRWPAARAQQGAAVQAAAGGRSASERDALRPAGAGRGVDGLDSRPRPHSRQRAHPGLAAGRPRCRRRPCPGPPSPPPAARLPPAHPAVSRRRLAARLLPLSGERPPCSLRAPAARTRRAAVRAAAACGAAGCRLLGTQADRLDPHRARRAGGDPVEPQAAEAAGRPAAVLDR
jgi:hypothetical protein